MAIYVRNLALLNNIGSYLIIIFGPKMSTIFGGKRNINIQGLSERMSKEFFFFVKISIKKKNIFLPF